MKEVDALQRGEMQLQLEALEEERAHYRARHRTSLREYHETCALPPPLDCTAPSLIPTVHGNTVRSWDSGRASFRCGLSSVRREAKNRVTINCWGGLYRTGK
jgi:hypothetical protein